MEELLHQKKCIPCEGGVSPFGGTEISNYIKKLDLEWEVKDQKKISHEFKFETYLKGIDFVNEVAKIAESEGHHPDIFIHYKKVKIELWTYAIGGLSENDFILAAKIEQL